MFSFNIEIWELILYSIKRLLPAAVKAIAVFYSADEKTLQAKSIIIENNNSIIELDISKCYSQINEVRKLKQNTWLNKSEIPFETDFGNDKNFSIFTETERNILTLSFYNNTDKKYDILYIYLPSHNYLTGIASSIKLLSQENKVIISQLVKNSINNIIEIASTDSAAYKELQDSVSRIKTLLKKKELETDKSSAWLEYAEHILNNNDFGNGKYNYIISEDAKRLINNYEGKIYNFADYIKNAAKSALILSNHKSNEKIIIETYNFSIIDESINETNNAKNININVEANYQKAYILLDRYEEAATKAIDNRPSEEKSKPLTGTEIGRHVGSGISAAAISDAIGKQRSQISKLLLKKELADNWPLLRKLFKPIINTLTPKEILREKIA